LPRRKPAHTGYSPYPRRCRRYPQCCPQLIDIGRSVSARVIAYLRLRARGASHGMLLLGGGARPSAPATERTGLRSLRSSHCSTEYKKSSWHPSHETFSDRPTGAGGFSLNTSGRQSKAFRGVLSQRFFDGRTNEGDWSLSRARNKSALGAEPLLE
jgi:hypothetical protein